MGQSSLAASPSGGGRRGVGLRGGLRSVGLRAFGLRGLRLRGLGLGIVAAAHQEQHDDDEGPGDQKAEEHRLRALAGAAGKDGLEEDEQREKDEQNVRLWLPQQSGQPTPTPLVSPSEWRANTRPSVERAPSTSTPGARDPVTIRPWPRGPQGRTRPQIGENRGPFTLLMDGLTSAGCWATLGLTLAGCWATLGLTLAGCWATLGRWRCSEVTPRELAPLVDAFPARGSQLVGSDIA